MPNHITTTLTAPAGVLNALINEEGDAPQEQGGAESNVLFVDFSKIVPEPENMERGGCSFGMDVHWDERGVARHENGQACWYIWNREAWGTKWNAYEFDQNELSEVVILAEDAPEIVTSITFQTAWSFPEPVIETLSKQFPESEVGVMFADEDLGSNCGAGVYLAGELVENTSPDQGTEEAYRFAVEVIYGDYDTHMVEEIQSTLEWIVGYHEKSNEPVTFYDLEDNLGELTMNYLKDRPEIAANYPSVVALLEATD